MYKQVCETVNELKERKLDLNKKLSNFDKIKGLVKRKPLNL